jgi:hypothetical protein
MTREISTELEKFQEILKKSHITFISHIHDNLLTFSYLLKKI